MNLVGQSYLALKQVLRNRSPEDLTHQQALTQDALQDWECYRNIDADELLEDILQYTAVHVPFYRKYFDSNAMLDSGDLSHWPILTRDLVREHFNELQADVPPRGKTWTHASGGSTGKPVTVVHDQPFAAKAQALRDLCTRLFFGGPYYNKLILWGMSEEVERQKQGEDSLAGEVKDKLLQLGGLKTTHINTFDFTQDKFEQCARILETQRPEFILGYAGSVYQLAKYLDDNNISAGNSVKKIGTTAQTLYPFMREKIEQVFNCKVCDHYGSREAGPLAWQHENGDMYFPKFFSRIEVVNTAGRHCAPGETGHILVTGLHNFTMPLIRYDIGDLGVQGMDSWYRSYPFSTLKKISGRSSDEFIRKDGTLVHSHFFIRLFYYRPWVEQFCVVQKAHERIEILYVPKQKDVPPPEADVQVIEERIRKAMTDGTEVLWREVEEVPKTRAGKRLFVRSEVEK
jgi:phenylacetate-CoA ligase